MVCLRCGEKTEKNSIFLLSALRKLRFIGQMWDSSTWTQLPQFWNFFASIYAPWFCMRLALTRTHGEIHQSNCLILWGSQSSGKNAALILSSDWGLEIGQASSSYTYWILVVSEDYIIARWDLRAVLSCFPQALWCLAAILFSACCHRSLESKPLVPWMCWVKLDLSLRPWEWLGKDAWLACFKCIDDAHTERYHGALKLTLNLPAPYFIPVVQPSMEAVSTRY